MYPNELSDFALAEIFAKTTKQSLQNQITFFQEYRAFYDGDFELIKDYLDKELEDTFSKETRAKLHYRHKDIIQKILRLKTGGLFDNEPERKVNDENVKDILTKWNYQNKIEEISKRAIFFNTVVAQPIVRNGKLQIDLITGDECLVTPDPEDYLIGKEFRLKRQDYETNEIYIAFWSEDEHYITDLNGNVKTTWNGKTLKNNYGFAPFEALRLREGMDYWGEPNTNMLQAQKDFDLDLTGLKRIREFQSFGVWLAINCNLGDQETLSPNRLLRINDLKSDMVKPSIECIVPQVRFGDLQNLIDWERKLTLMSEGISPNNGNLDITGQSGVSKWMDEIEIQIQREKYKLILKQFELNLLEKCRVVAKAEGIEDQLPEGEITVNYLEDVPTETNSEKIERRNFNKENYIEDEVDFVMQDKELGVKDALDHIQERKDRRKGLQLEVKTTTDLVSNLFKPEETEEEETPEE